MARRRLEQVRRAKVARGALERAAGGALLGTSRTVSGGRMVAFEFLRIVEKGGQLLYVAQPGGATPTEFILVELDETRAVFEDPFHDFPQRIEYERADDQLVAEISFIDGRTRSASTSNSRSDRRSGRRRIVQQRLETAPLAQEAGRRRAGHRAELAGQWPWSQ